MSEKPRSLGQESRSLAQEGSLKTLYEPLWPTKTPYKASKGASARAPPQHTDPNEVSFERKAQEATSKGSHNPGRQSVHCGLRYTSRTSQTEDSKRVIANLRQEVSDLKREARGRTPIKEKPRNRVNASKRGNPKYSNIEEFPDTSGSQSESRSSTTHRKPRSLEESSRSRPPLYGRKNPQAKKHSSRKTPRLEEQNAVWRALNLVSSSPFSREIEKARLPERFTAPRFETYNGRTDPMSHIGHYQQTMTVSRLNEPLMYLLFPSSLGEVAMRWFNQLGRRTINSWDQMAEAFVARFITNSRKAREMDALLTMKLQDNKTIKNYSIRYWETYNDIDGRSEEVAIKVFKLGLPVDSGLRHSLVKHQPSSLVKLMKKIEQFVRLEEDGKGTTPVQTNTQPKIFTPKHPAPTRSSLVVKSLSGPKDFAAPSFRAFGTVFKEPIYRLIEKIKREPFFTWPSKLIGNPDSRDAKLYCNYHKDTGHMTENCHKLKVHLEHLVTEGISISTLILSSVK